MPGNLPFIPFVTNANDVIFLFFVFGRVTGFFAISPLFSNTTIPPMVRVLLSVFATLLLGMILYPEYCGDNPKFILKDLFPETEWRVAQLSIGFMKEMAVGYLMGFAFTMIFEALVLAGELVGVMMGFSMAQVLDPMMNVSQGILSQLFVLVATLIMLTMDLHLAILGLLSDSFVILPMGSYSMPYEMLADISQGSARMFNYGLKFAAIPFVVLFLMTIALGFMAKVMPEMNVFMVGFPLGIFIGYYSLVASIGYFPQILSQAFTEYNNLARIVLFRISGAS